MACPSDTPGTMHEDAFLLVVGLNEKRKDMMGEQIRISESKILNWRPANVLRPKIASISTQKIINIISKLLWGKKTDDLPDSLLPHKGKPVI